MVSFQDLQNANVQFGNVGSPNKQTGVCTQIPPSYLPDHPYPNEQQ